MSRNGPAGEVESRSARPRARSSRADGLALLQPALRVLAGADPGQLRLIGGSPDLCSPLIERYAAVPSLADPRALLPLDATPSAWRALLRQHAAGAASPAARGAVQMLRVASCFGLTSVLLRDRVSVLAVRAGTSETPVHNFLAQVLGRRDFVTGLRLAPGRPNGKPVIEAVAQDGTVLSYAKFGWEGLTRRLVRREAEVLRELGPLTRGLPLRVPSVLYTGEWGDHEALVLAPLSCMGRTPRSARQVPIAASVALAGLRPRSVGRLADSPFWARMTSKAAQLLPLLSENTGGIALAACRAVEARWGDRKVISGQSHGDWIPSNMSIRTDGAFNVWDWERSESDVPLGMDAMQFILFLELLRGPPNRGLAGRLHAYGRNALSRHGLDPRNCGLLMTLSLLTSILWFGEAREAGREQAEDGRFVRALEAVLDSFKAPDKGSHTLVAAGRKIGAGARTA